jgi:hypothetical protein
MMTITKLEGLNQGHWVFADFRQRMTTKEWKQVLLAERDIILYRGNFCQLRAKKLGYGVVEVYKDLPKEKSA